MPVMARCSECGKQYRMRDEFAGRTVPCKECGADFQVPGGRPAAARPPAGKPRPARRDDFFEADDDSSGGSLMMWIIGGASAVAVIAGIVIAILVFAGGNGDDKKDGEKVAQKDAGDGDKEQNGRNPGLQNNFANNAGNGGNAVPGNNGGQGNNVNPPGQNVPQPNPRRRNPGGLQPPPANNNPPAFGGNNNPPILGGNNNPPVNRNPGGLIPAGNNGQPQPVFGNSNAAAWNVQVDPPKEPIEFKKKGRLTVLCPKFFFVNAKYPSANSAFVALGSNSKANEHRDVYDLRTGTRIGQIGGLNDTFSRSGILSPDGKYFAIKTRETKNILLWDVKGKKALGQLPLDEKTQRGSLQVLEFAGTNRLVAAGRDTPLWIWSLPDGKPQKSVDLPKGFEKSSVAFSHGGRYATLYLRSFQNKTISVYDLEKGTEAGRITMPDDLSLSHCRGMAFSPDGEELAALFEFVGKARLFVWNVKDGKQVVHHSFQTAGRNYTGPAVQWFPDKSKWLVMGNDVIDRKAGGPVWSVPKVDGARNDADARLIGGDRIAIFGESRGVKAIATMDIPLDEIAKGAKVVSSGGSTEDVGLPPLRIATWNNAFMVPVNGVANGWSVQPDVSKSPAATLTGSMNIDSSFGRVTGVLLSRRDVSQALVVCQTAATTRIRSRRRRRQADPANAAGAMVRLDRYDLGTQKRLDSVSLDYPADLVGYSPSGKRALVRYKRGEDRVDCWSLDEKKHVVGWKPYKDEKNSFYKRVATAAFVDDDHVLTSNGHNKLVLWKLPECTAVYVMEQVRHPLLSPNAKYLAVVIGRQYRLFDALTGKPAGDISLNGTPLAAAFHPNGERFAIVSLDVEGTKLGTWNLKTGQAEGDFPLPSSGTSLHFCGDDHALLGDRQLIDLKHKMVVWSYSGAGAIASPTSPDGRHWYLAGPNPVTLTAVALPDADATKHLAGKKLEPKMILKPGMKVGLNIQLNGIAGHQNLSDEVFKDWSRKFQARGITIDQKNAPLVLFARADSKSTGKSKTYVRSSSRFGFGPVPRFGGRIGPRVGGPAAGGTSTENVSETLVNCRIVFGQDGKAYGERKVAISNLLSSFLIKKGESAQNHLNKRQADSAAGFFRGYTPPGYLFDNGAENGLGSSQFVSGGTRTVAAN